MIAFPRVNQNQSTKALLMEKSVDLRSAESRRVERSVSLAKRVVYNSFSMPPRSFRTEPCKLRTHAPPRDHIVLFAFFLRNPGMIFPGCAILFEIIFVKSEVTDSELLCTDFFYQAEMSTNRADKSVQKQRR